jgi:soluble lytic murein transglycosylase-like protein
VRSYAGAVGLMQLMPATAKRYGVKNRRNPAQNISGGTRYLKDLLKMFNSNLKLAVAAYNAGENAVIKYRNSIPPYRETRNYVKKVLRFYQQTS